MPDNQSPELFGQTPWQTVGPFFHYGLPWKGCADMTGASPLGARPDLFPADHYLLREPAMRGDIPGTPIGIQGRVLDGEGKAVPDALVEIWQADSEGRYGETRHGFSGFGRCATGDDGGFRFLTIRPGRVPGPDGALQAAHVAVGVLGRGLIKRLTTRLYFADGEGLDSDPILALVPLARRGALLAKPDGGVYHCDIVLQGQSETVFFEF